MLPSCVYISLCTEILNLAPLQNWRFTILVFTDKYSCCCEHIENALNEWAISSWQGNDTTGVGGSCRQLSLLWRNVCKKCVLVVFLMWIVVVMWSVFVFEGTQQLQIFAIRPLYSHKSSFRIEWPNDYESEHSFSFFETNPNFWAGIDSNQVTAFMQSVANQAEFQRWQRKSTIAHTDRNEFIFQCLHVFRNNKFCFHHDTFTMFALVQILISTEPISVTRFYIKHFMHQVVIYFHVPIVPVLYSS